MGVLANLLSPELRSLPPNGHDWWYENLPFLGSKTLSGKVVTQETALSFIAVYAANLILAESMGQLPAGLFRLTDQGSEPDREHPLWSVLHDAPNDEISSIDFRGAMQGSIGLYGNAYARIVRDFRGRTKELWPMNAAFVEIEYAQDSLRSYRYKYSEPKTGKVYYFNKYDILHLRGWTPPDSIEGYSPIRVAREAIGSAMAVDEYGSRFFGQGANLGGWIKHPGPLGEEGRKNLTESIKAYYTGLKNAHGILVLEEGAEYAPLAMNMADAEFIALKKLGVTEIARLYRIPPHMLADLERATFSNIEHQGLEFVVHTLMPHIVRWEQGIKQRLLGPTEGKRYQVKFNVNAFMRGDVANRAKFYAAGRTGGWLSPNDIRDLEDMNKRPDGDSYDMPLNSNAAGDNKNEPGTSVPAN